MLVFFILTLWVKVFLPTPHDFHNSLAEMDYNVANQRFEVSLRVFADDFEDILKRENQLEKLKLSKNKTHEPLIEAYLKKHFVLRNAKKQAKTLNYLGKEIEGEVVWLYFEIPFADKIDKATLQYSILLDLFDDQANLINVSYKKQKQTLLFGRAEPVQTLQFKEK